jgi:hypothetical protein
VQLPSRWGGDLKKKKSFRCINILGEGKKSPDVTPSQTSLAELRFNSVASLPPTNYIRTATSHSTRGNSVRWSKRNRPDSAGIFFFFLVRNKCFNSCHLGLDCSRAANGGTEPYKTPGRNNTQKSCVESWSRLSRCCNSFPFERSAGKEKERRGCRPSRHFQFSKGPDTRISHTFMQATYAHDVTGRRRRRRLLSTSKNRRRVHIGQSRKIASPIGRSAPILAPRCTSSRFHSKRPSYKLLKVINADK